MFGGIDIFVNAAGVHTENVDFWSVTSDEYDRVMNINLSSDNLEKRNYGQLILEKSGGNCFFCEKIIYDQHNRKIISVDDLLKDIKNVKHNSNL